MMKPDLESIYLQLDVSPGSSLEEFQRAYRKRIGELHPDRHSGPRSAESQAALRDLIWVHAAVNRFHRRYGRMPGAHSSKFRGADPRTSTARTDLAPYDSGYKRGNQSTVTLVTLLIALLILLASWSWLTSGNLRRASWPVDISAATVIATTTAIAPPAGTVLIAA